jgi:hypothetical protein
MDKYAKQLIENKPFSVSLVAEAYEKRMDAYLGAARYRRALADYSRAVAASDNDGKYIERWRSVGKTKDGERFIDIKTVEFSPQPRLWMKTTKAKGYELDSFEVDCGGRRIRTVSEHGYDDEGKMTNSSGASGWQPIIPDTLGEQFFTATCND